jgi:hypothetical protein
VKRTRRTEEVEDEKSIHENTTARTRAQTNIRRPTYTTVEHKMTGFVDGETHAIGLCWHTSVKKEDRRQKTE